MSRASNIMTRMAKALIAGFGKLPDRYDDLFLFKRIEEPSNSTCFKDDKQDASFAFVLDEKDDVVYGSGRNLSGLLATGDRKDIKKGFIKIEHLSGRGIIDICAGYDHALALTKDGKILSWGENDFGQLGNGTDTEAMVPQEVKLDQNIKIKSIAAGMHCSWALSQDCQVFVWGSCFITGYGGQVVPLHLITHVADPVIDLLGSHSTAFVRDTTNRLYALEPDISTNCRATLVPFDYEKQAIKQFVAADEIFGILTETGRVYVWGGFNPLIRAPILLELDKKVKTIFSIRFGIILLFEDNNAALYQQDIGHTKADKIASIDDLIAMLDSLHTLKSYASLDLKLKDWERKPNKPSFGDASDLFNKEDYADIRFCFNNGEQQEDDGLQAKVLHAHRNVLAHRSQVFHKRFSGKWNGSKKIPINFTSYEAFYAFLYYIYSGRVVTDSLNSLQLIELYDLGEQYSDAYLKWKAEKYLCKKLDTTSSFEELHQAYLLTRHLGLQEKILERMGHIISIENCLKTARFAHANKVDPLLKQVGRFILNNRKLLSNRLDLLQYDLEFAQDLIQSILDA